MQSVGQRDPAGSGLWIPSPSCDPPELCVCPWSVCATASLQPGTEREAAALLFSMAAQQKKAGEGSACMAFLPGLMLIQIISVTAG